MCHNFYRPLLKNLGEHLRLETGEGVVNNDIVVHRQGERRVRHSLVMRFFVICILAIIAIASRIVLDITWLETGIAWGFAVGLYSYLQLRRPSANKQYESDLKAPTKAKPTHDYSDLARRAARRAGLLRTDVSVVTVLPSLVRKPANVKYEAGQSPVHNYTSPNNYHWLLFARNITPVVVLFIGYFTLTYVMFAATTNFASMPFAQPAYAAGGVLVTLITLYVIARERYRITHSGVYVYLGEDGNKRIIVYTPHKLFFWFTGGHLIIQAGEAQVYALDRTFIQMIFRGSRHLNIDTPSGNDTLSRTIRHLKNAPEVERAYLGQTDGELLPHQLNS